MPTLTCPHCGASGESSNRQQFRLLGRAETKAVVRCMRCDGGFSKGPLSRAKKIPDAAWAAILNDIDPPGRPTSPVVPGGAGPADGSQIFRDTAGTLAMATKRNDALYEQDQLLCTACLVAAGRTMSSLATGEGPIADFLSRVSEEQDEWMAGCVIMATSWYFLFRFGFPRIPEDRRTEWVLGLVDGLAPAEEVEPDDLGPLPPLFDAYARGRGDGDAFARFAMRFARWFWSQTYIEDHEHLVLMSAPHLLHACQQNTAQFDADLAEAGLA